MTVCWYWWRTGDLYVPHRCQQPQGHTGPHICNCNTTTTDKETTVTDHPAKPAGYKPFRTPAQIEADARADERQRIADELEAEMSIATVRSIEAELSETAYYNGVHRGLSIAERITNGRWNA